MRQPLHWLRGCNMGGTGANNRDDDCESIGAKNAKGVAGGPWGGPRTERPGGGPSAVWATAGVAWQAAPWAEHIRAAWHGRHVRGGGLPLLWEEYPWSTLEYPATRSYVQERFDTVGQALHTGMTRSANLHVRPLARLKHARARPSAAAAAAPAAPAAAAAAAATAAARRGERWATSLGLRSRGQPHPTTRRAWATVAETSPARTRGGPDGAAARRVAHRPRRKQSPATRRADTPCPRPPPAALSLAIQCSRVLWRRCHGRSRSLPDSGGSTQSTFM